MAIVKTDDKHYKDIANAIREFGGITQSLPPKHMAGNIEIVYDNGYDVGYADGQSAGGGGNTDEAYQQGVQAGLDLFLQKTSTSLYSELETIGAFALYTYTSLTSVDFPNAKTIGASALYGCTGLTVLDFPKVTYLSGSSLRNCSNLTALILRVDAVCTLQHTNAFIGNPIESGTGYVYVPSALCNAYKAATNWSTYANQIRAIEDYPEITGG